MTEENEAFEDLAKRQGDWGLQGSRKHQIMRYLENNAMRETQRLGQEIEPEPVAWLSTDIIGERHLCFDKPLDNDPVQPLYTTPPQRTWVGLTNQERSECWDTIPERAMKKVEAKLKDKNQ